MEAEIRHMVAFSLKYPMDDPRTMAFINDAKRIFASIDVAKNVMQCYEISLKNDFNFGFSFDFHTREDYDEYNRNPLHIKFVEERWNVEVADFIEIDFREIR